MRESISSKLDKLNEKELQAVLRFIQHLQMYPELHDVRVWLFKTLLNCHDRVLNFALNVLMFIAPFVLGKRG